MMSKEKRRVPKLRFPGFTEDWEQRKLESILIEYTEKNPGNEDLPVLTSSRQGLTKQEDHFGSVQRHDISDYNVIPLGFCTYRNRSDDKTFTFNINRIVSRGLVSKFYPVFDINNGNVDFITAYLNNNIGIIKSLAVNAIGTSQVVLSLRTLRNIEVTLPSKMEQVAIGNYIRKLDIYITLHQRKLNNLKLKKKALLQKLFPKNGERYPELRFPGFTDAWEQRKFSDLYEKISEKNDLSYSLDKIISVANMYYKSDAKVSNEEYLKTYNIFRYGEIAFEGNKSKDFAYGRFVENTIGDGIISHVFEVFRPIAKYDIYFWKYYINYEAIMGKILSRCTKKTTMMTNLVAKDFLKETVLVPTLAEQKQIGTLLNAIDKFITLHQRKLDHLQLQKKALLQQMFV